MPSGNRLGSEGPGGAGFLGRQPMVLRRFTMADADDFGEPGCRSRCHAFAPGGVLHDQIENKVLPAFLGYYQRYEYSASIGATVIRSCRARASCRPSVLNASA